MPPHPRALALATALFLAHCGPTPAATDAGSDAAIQATCASYCACMSAACPSFPFAPSCMTACMDTTMNWDLTCRADHCAAAQSNPMSECTIASGQTVCR